MRTSDESVKDYPELGSGRSHNGRVLEPSNPLGQDVIIVSLFLAVLLAGPDANWRGRCR